MSAATLDKLMRDHVKSLRWQFERQKRDARGRFISGWEPIPVLLNLPARWDNEPANKGYRVFGLLEEPGQYESPEVRDYSHMYAKR